MLLLVASSVASRPQAEHTFVSVTVRRLLLYVQLPCFLNEVQLGPNGWPARACVRQWGMSLACLGDINPVAPSWVGLGARASSFCCQV